MRSHAVLVLVLILVQAPLALPPAFAQDVTPPIADAGEDVEAVEQGTVTFDGTGSSDDVGITNWTWSFEYIGEDVLLYGPRPSHQFDRPGTYNVNLTVSDAVGNNDTDSVMVTVLDTTSPVPDVVGNRTVDMHTEVVLEDASWDNVGVVSWTWDFTYDGAPRVQTEPTFAFTFHTPGSYAVLLTVHDAAGNTGNMVVPVTVRDNEPPTVVGPGNLTVDSGAIVTLDATGTTDNVGVASITWTFEYGGDTVELVGKVSYYVFDEPGEYVVTLTVADDAGNVVEETFTVTVEGGDISIGIVALALVVLIVIIVGLALYRRRMMGDEDEAAGPPGFRT